MRLKDFTFIYAGVLMLAVILIGLDVMEGMKTGFINAVTMTVTFIGLSVFIKECVKNQTTKDLTEALPISSLFMGAIFMYNSGEVALKENIIYHLIMMAVISVSIGFVLAKKEKERKQKELVENHIKEAARSGEPIIKRVK